MLGHFSAPRSLQKLRIAPNCRFVHALLRGSGRRAQLRKKKDFLAEEESTFYDLLPRTSVCDIDVFRSIKRVDVMIHATPHWEGKSLVSERI